MFSDTKKILKDTPYNTYEDLFSAVYNNKARIHLSNLACREISRTEKPIFSAWGLYLGIIPSSIITILLSIGYQNYYLLLLLLLEFIFPITIYFLKNLMIKIGWFTLAFFLFDLLILKVPFPITTTCWLICYWIAKKWGQSIYKTSIRILRDDESLFVWAFESHNLQIEDLYGNIYSKSNQREDNEPVTKEKSSKVPHSKELTDKDYQTMLKCINFSIGLYKNEFENEDDNRTDEEKNDDLETIQSLEELYDIFYSKQKPCFLQNTLAIACVRTYFDFIDSQLKNNPSEERKKLLLKQLEEISSVFPKLEPTQKN